MKVLFIAPYADGTGYSHAAIEYILSLDTVGVDVVSRPVKMTPTSGFVPDRIKKLEQKDLNNVDTVIQHNLPDQFIYQGGIQNIGLFDYETNSLPDNFWKDHLELMDKIVVPSDFQKNALDLVDKNLGAKTHVVPHAVDVDKFNKQYDQIDFKLPTNTLKFYTISEYNKRKNLLTLLLSYFSIFNSDDNVVLIIKTTGDREQFKNVVEEVKRGCRRFKNHDRYPNVILINDYLTEDEMCSLHISSDIFVSSSRGEAFCLPAVDAMGFGNHIIVPYHTAFADYIDILPSISSTAIRSSLTPSFGSLDAPYGLYMAEELWYHVDIAHLAKIMHDKYLENYKEKDSADNKLKRSQAIVDIFNRTAIGTLLREAIYAN